MIFNELLEALMCADIPKRARRLIDVQMRFSFGCGPKTFTSLTKSEYAALANLDWSDAHRALQWLLEKGFSNRMKGHEAIPAEQILLRLAGPGGIAGYSGLQEPPRQDG